MTESSDQETIENLKLLLQVSRQMAAIVELEPLLEQITSAGCKVLHCERATVFLLDTDSNELYSKFATGSTKEIRFPANMGIAGEVATTGTVSNVPDAYADSRFNPAIDKKTGFRTRNILTIPLDGLQGQRVGVLQLLNREGRPFDAEDEELAATLGAQCGVALQRQALLEQYAKKLKLERELDIAREIQMQMLPRQDPDVPGYQVSGWNLPADKTGGDCYDFIPTRGGQMGILLADATGHGITAAMCISQFRALVKATVRLSANLPRMVSHVNSLLDEDMPDDRFVTAFLGALHHQANALAYVTAGQHPLLHYHRATGKAEILDEGDVPIGVVEGHEYELSGKVDFKPGDMFCLLTDGFHEWANREGEEFGLERLIEVIEQNAELTPKDLIHKIHHEVVSYSNGTRQADDLTAIIVERLQST